MLQQVQLLNSYSWYNVPDNRIVNRSFISIACIYFDLFHLFISFISFIYSFISFIFIYFIYLFHLFHLFIISFISIACLFFKIFELFNSWTMFWLFFSNVEYEMYLLVETFKMRNAVMEIDEDEEDRMSFPLVLWKENFPILAIIFHYGLKVCNLTGAKLY